MGAAALPAPMKTKEKVEQGKGTTDYLMPLGYLLKSFSLKTKSESMYFLKMDLQRAELLWLRMKNYHLIQDDESYRFKKRMNKKSYQILLLTLRWNTMV